MDEPQCTFRPGVPGLIPDAWIVGPATSSVRPPVVAVHGITRRIEEMARLLSGRALAIGRTIVLPQFDHTSWPRYQRAACSNRADWALLRLMTALRDEGHVPAGPFDLSGFSGGAQFAHRFAWLYPEMVGRLCATAPGWWTFPDTQACWPYGMGAPSAGAESFRLHANLRRFLDHEIVVCVGSDDVERDASLRQGPGIDAQQGTTRLQRARRWCNAAEAVARSQGLAPNITLRVLQGCGHSFADCIVHGGLDRDFCPGTSRCAASRCASCTHGAACRTASSFTVDLMERTAA